MERTNQPRKDRNTAITVINENAEEITSKYIVSNYFQSTTIHGISSIYSGRSFFMKLFWLIVFLSVFGLLIRQVYEISMRLTKYEVLTVVEKTAHQSMEFPAVTLCSTRPFRKSSATLRELKKAIRYSLTSNVSHYGPTINEFLIHETFCSFDERQCNFGKDFLVTTSLSLGNCFTLKANSSRRQEHLGQKYGFRIAININQENFTNYDAIAALASRDRQLIHRFLPVGARVMIHSENENIEFLADTNAILVSPGTMTNILITKQHFERLPPPYPDHCVEEESADKVIGRPIPGTTSYSVSLCKFMCKINEQMKHCKAVESTDLNHLKLLFPNDTFYRTPHTFKEYICLYYEFQKLPNVTRYCRCPQPCKEQKYKLTVSAALWPSNDDVTYMCSLLPHAGIKLGRACTKEVIKDNILRLQIYFNDFTVESIKQSPAYGPDQFISDLGGSVGLWIGASIYSLFELGSLCISLASLLILKIRKVVQRRRGRVEQLKTVAMHIDAEEGRAVHLAART
eukprot:Seg5197.1 transcript_id=Seg5197.1/GoldUCD/mRNA.D3Y31 product="Acid-sensing ion channel 4-A" protein_id=Seg5197.1/GoldUCD/D3Y31